MTEAIEPSRALVTLAEPIADANITEPNASATDAPLRMFVAIELSDSWRARLSATAHALEVAAPGFVRWAKPSTYHITLAFLGNQPKSGLPAITESLAEAARGRKPFTLIPGQLGSFGARAAVDVVWAGITCQPYDAFGDVRKALTNALDARRITFDKSPFRPHITLGRSRRRGDLEGSAALRPALKEAKPWATGEQPCAEIVLFQSDLRPTGPIYTPLHRAPFFLAESEFARAQPTD